MRSLAQSRFKLALRCPIKRYHTRKDGVRQHHKEKDRDMCNNTLLWETLQVFAIVFIAGVVPTAAWGSDTGSLRKAVKCITPGTSDFCVPLS